MKATLRFIREIKNLLKDSEDVSIHFLFSTIDEHFFCKSNEKESRQSQNLNLGGLTTRNGGRKTESATKLADDSISAYILLRTLPNSLYKQNIYCLKFSITQKYPIEAPDVLFVKGREIIKTIEQIVDDKILENQDDEFISEKGVHCRKFLQNHNELTNLEHFVLPDCGELRTQSSLSENNSKIKFKKLSLTSILEKKLLKLLDHNDLDKFLHCREPVGQKIKKKTFLDNFKRLFINKKPPKNESEAMYVSGKRTELVQNPSSTTISRLTNDQNSLIDRREDNQVCYDKKNTNKNGDRVQKKSGIKKNAQSAQNTHIDPDVDHVTNEDDLNCCEITMSQIVNFLSQIRIPLHPHIYSNGHICSSLMRDWAPVHNMTVISMSFLAALNTNNKEEGPENDGLYSFLNKKGSRNAKWLYEGEM